MRFVALTAALAALAVGRAHAQATFVEVNQYWWIIVASVLGAAVVAALVFLTLWLCCLRARANRNAQVAPAPQAPNRASAARPAAVEQPQARAALTGVVPVGVAPARPASASAAAAAAAAASTMPVAAPLSAAGVAAAASATAPPQPQPAAGATSGATLSESGEHAMTGPRLNSGKSRAMPTEAAQIKAVWAERASDRMELGSSGSRALPPLPSLPAPLPTLASAAPHSELAASGTAAQQQPQTAAVAESDSLATPVSPVGAESAAPTGAPRPIVPPLALGALGDTRSQPTAVPLAPTTSSSSVPTSVPPAAPAESAAPSASADADDAHEPASVVSSWKEQIRQQNLKLAAMYPSVARALQRAPSSAAKASSPHADGGHATAAGNTPDAAAHAFRPLALSHVGSLATSQPGVAEAQNGFLSEPAMLIGDDVSANASPRNGAQYAVMSPRSAMTTQQMQQLALQQRLSVQRSREWQEMQSNVLSNSNMALAQQQQMQAQMQQQQQQQPQQQIVQMNGRAFTAVPGPNGMMMLTAAPGAVGASIGSAPVRRSGGSTYDDDPLGEPIYGRTRRRSRSRASARSGDGSRPASRASSTSGGSGTPRRGRSRSVSRSSMVEGDRNRDTGRERSSSPRSTASRRSRTSSASRAKKELQRWLSSSPYGNAVGSVGNMSPGRRATPRQQSLPQLAQPQQAAQAPLQLQALGPRTGSSRDVLRNPSFLPQAFFGR